MPVPRMIQWIKAMYETLLVEITVIDTKDEVVNTKVVVLSAYDQYGDQFPGMPS